VRSAGSVGNCTLTVDYPEIVGYSGDDYARGQDDIECPFGYIEATVTDDLYRSTTFIADDSDSGFQEPIFVFATALHNCYHPNSTYQYRNTGLGYVEYADGTAATNTITAYKNHSCPS